VDPFQMKKDEMPGDFRATAPPHGSHPSIAHSPTDGYQWGSDRLLVREAPSAPHPRSSRTPAAWPTAAARCSAVDPAGRGPPSRDLNVMALIISFVHLFFHCPVNVCPRPWPCHDMIMNNRKTPETQIPAASFLHGGAEEKSLPTRLTIAFPSIPCKLALKSPPPQSLAHIQASFWAQGRGGGSLPGAPQPQSLVPSFAQKAPYP